MPEQDYDLTDPAVQAVVATRPNASVPGWTLDDNPDEETASKRAQDFLRVHAIADRSHEETVANFQRHFPGVDPTRDGDYSYWRDRAPGELNLDCARKFVGENVPAEEPSGVWWGRRIGKTAFGAITNYQYGGAKKRFDSGEHSDANLQTIAEFEHLQNWDRKQNETLGGAVGSAALSLPEMGL